MVGGGGGHTEGLWKLDGGLCAIKGPMPGRVSRNFSALAVISGASVSAGVAPPQTSQGHARQRRGKVVHRGTRVEHLCLANSRGLITFSSAFFGFLTLNS